MLEKKQNGGMRDGAGRPKGSRNRRSLEAIEKVAEKYPEWSPLMHMATVANDESLPVDIRLDAAKSAAPFMLAKAKSAVLDHDELIELESEIARVRIEESSKTIKNNPLLGDLANRLARAFSRRRDV